MSGILIDRLSGIHGILMASFEASAKMSSSTIGSERENFVKYFLSDILPPPFRIGSGDIIDSKQQRSGQVDIVIEYPFLPSFPLPNGEKRLYFAEGVAAVIEVKSEIAQQWQDVLRTKSSVKALERKYERVVTRHHGEEYSHGVEFYNKIPVYGVGYKGWARIETLREKTSPNNEGKIDIDGLLVLESKLFSSQEFTLPKESFSCLLAFANSLLKDLKMFREIDVNFGNYVKVLDGIA